MKHQAITLELNVAAVFLERYRLRPGLYRGRLNCARQEALYCRMYIFDSGHFRVLIIELTFVLKDRLDTVEERIQNACRRAGRARSDVILVAVTKVFPATVIRDAYALGVRHFGENYVQEFAGKAPAVADLDGAIIHLIGHLQSNKSKIASELFDVIQTVDSPKLAKRLNDSGKRLQVMIEVKLSPEETKAGASPAELPSLIDAIRGCENLEFLGLMTMPPWSDDAEPSRPYFRRLRDLATAYGVAKLSMGMSHDLEVAIEEGATHVRVGTALFGSRRKA
jgi:pyridoxal phosphate enzyme (YggS family)